MRIRDWQEYDGPGLAALAPNEFLRMVKVPRSHLDELYEIHFEMCCPDLLPSFYEEVNFIHNYFLDWTLPEAQRSIKDWRRVLDEISNATEQILTSLQLPETLISELEMALSRVTSTESNIGQQSSRNYKPTTYAQVENTLKELQSASALLLDSLPASSGGRPPTRQGAIHLAKQYGRLFDNVWHRAGRDQELIAILRRDNNDLGLFAVLPKGKKARFRRPSVKKADVVKTYESNRVDFVLDSIDTFRESLQELNITHKLPVLRKDEVRDCVSGSSALWWLELDSDQQIVLEQTEMDS